MNEFNKTEVLIVGAGPTGLMAAAELTRRGIACRIIDKCAGPSDKSKALGVQARTLEVFDYLGIADEAVARGNKIHAGRALYDGEQLLQFRIDELESPFSFLLALPQSETEKLLIDYLLKHDLKVERLVELVDFQQDDSGVTAELRGPDGEFDIRADWMIGADGPHSTVRHLLNLPFEGTPYPETFYLADVRGETDLPHDEFSLFASEDGIIGCIPMADEQFRIVAQVPDKYFRSKDDPHLEDFHRLLKFKAVPLKITECTWLASFHIHQRKVQQYHVHRVFLAGDASHIHSPAGGQGMNTGIQDSF